MMTVTRVAELRDSKEDGTVKRHVVRMVRAVRVSCAGWVALAWLSTPLMAQDNPAVAPRQEAAAVAKSYEVFSQQQQTLEGLQSQLEALAAKRRAIQSEQAYVNAKIAWAKTKLAGRGSADGQDATYQAEIDKWQREVKAWEARQADAQDRLSKMVAEEEALMKALGEVARSRDETDMLIPGETIELYVAEDDSFNGLYQVRTGGFIVVPRLPKIYVAGKTLKEVEVAIRDELGKNQLRDATVTVDRVVAPAEAPAETGDILYVTGEVQKPGPWPIPSGYSPTAVTLMLRTPLTMYADLERVQVLRLVEGRALIETVNVQAIMDGAGLTQDFTLNPNDIVIVPAKLTGEHDGQRRRDLTDRRVYVQGNVVKPGEVLLRPPARMTVLAAIRHCGGHNRNADLSTLELIRIERERTRREIINLGAIMRGEEADVDLDGEDILVLYGKDERSILQPVRVYLSGCVKKEGPVEIKGDEGELTVLQVLLHNGGYARFADLKGVCVLRDMGNGIRNRIPVDMKKVEKGIIPDLILQDNDVVVVPEKFFSF